MRGDHRRRFVEGDVSAVEILDDTGASLCFRLPEWFVLDLVQQLGLGEWQEVFCVGIVAGHGSQYEEAIRPEAFLHCPEEARVLLDGKVVQRLVTEDSIKSVLRFEVEPAAFFLPTSTCRLV